MPVRSNVVAVIEDDAVTREALRLMLASLDCETELYDSAETFLLRVGESTATCLLVDVELDGVSGIELARGLATAGFRFPIVFMTASADPTIRQRAADTGSVAFLRKPIAPDELAAALGAARRQSESR
jgi:FixJ family two-component response regulator